MYELDDGLTITDVSDPTNPLLLSTSFEGELTPSPIAVFGAFAYIANLEGFTVFNVSDPVVPFEIGRLLINWLPTGIAVDGETVFVVVQDAGLRIIDISNPENPQEAGAWHTALDVRDFVVSDGFAYMACGDGGFRVIDATDHGAPTEVGFVNPSGEALGVSVSGSIATIALGSAGMGIFNISSPLQPEMLTMYSTGEPVWDVALSGTTAYVAVGAAGEVSPPFSRNSKPPYGADLGEYGGFRVVDLSTPMKPVERASFNLRITAMDIAARDELEYVASGDAGLVVYKPQASIFDDDIWGQLDTPGFAVGVTLHDHHALVADLHKGLRIIDVSDPTNLAEVGFVDTPGEAHKVAVSGGQAFVADGDSGLRVIDISSPENPIEIGVIDTPGNAIDVAVSGDAAFVADADEGIRIIDISDPSQPVELAKPGWIYDARAVDVADDMALVISRFVPYGEWTQLHVLDVSDPSDPHPIGIKKTMIQGDPTDIEISGAFAFITSLGSKGLGPGGLDIIDISRLWDAERVGTWQLSSEVTGLCLSEGRAYLAGGERGVSVLDVRCLTTYWVDIVAHLSGLNHSEWRSDVIINNESRPWDPYGMNKSFDPFTAEFVLHTPDGILRSEGAIVSRGQGVFEDIVGMFGYEGMGALEIHTEVPVSVFSRVYNETENGTFGSLSPAYRSSDCLVRGESGWLYGLRQVKDEFRTNISVTNTGTEARTATVTLYQSDGTGLAEYSLMVEPGMVVQDPQPFKKRARKPNVGWGFAKVTGEGLLASATVIDSRTNDPVFVPMLR
jgi:hypothetical protein